MSAFEIIMLVCFGSAWPLSIYKSLRSRAIAGKSLPFLVVILVGYAAGTLHKIFHSMDFVIVLYILNFLMVLTDIVLYFRNRLYHIKMSLGELKPGGPTEGA
jgi:hypothetical protein